MKVLFDECVPVPLKRLLPGHECVPPTSAGVAGLSNGKLLAAAAEQGIDCLLTMDKSVMKQQNLSALPLPVLLLKARSNTVEDLAEHVPAILGVLRQRLQRRVYVIPDRE
jgi:predicted nuclease of predicted toxin-antitoxin system